MRPTTTIALLSILLLTLVGPASGYQIASGHPRLFFRAAEVAALRTKCAGPLASEYQSLKSWCDSHKNDSLPLSEANYEAHLAAYSFVYLMSQDATYAARAKTIAQSIVSGGSEESGGATIGLAHFFDWCYDYLTSAERQTFGAALGRGGEWNHDQVDWPSTLYYHCALSWLRPVVLAGIALYGEGIDNAAATLCCDAYRTYVFEDPYQLCCLDEVAPDGSWYEAEYQYYRIYYEGREGLEAWAVATTDATNNAWMVSGNFRNLGRYYLYEAGARSGSSFIGSKQGDCHEHSFPSSYCRPTLYNVATRLNDPALLWLANEMKDQGLPGAVAPYNWRVILWNKTSLAEVNPETIYGRDSSTYFEGMGTVYCRSGWDISSASNDIYAVFRCESFPAIHTHAHQNHFLIARGPDLLAVDSGVYDSSISSHSENYFARTVAHNTITVYDPNETTFGAYANDGGQKPESYSGWGRLSLCGDASKPSAYRGRIVAYEDSPAVTYAKGDATAAFASSKVTQAVREFVWIKPDVFVILDRVTATSPSFKKTWLLHSIQEPVVSGDTVTITQGDSRLFVKSVLPSPRTITKIGGAGHQFEVNGVNYPPTISIPSDAGAWRFEVSPTVSAAQHLFLTVLYVAGTGVTSMPAVAPIDAGDMVGCQIGDRVILFSKTGAAVDGVTYQYGSAN